MKVLIFSKMFPRPDNENFGTYVYAQVNELIKCSVKVKLISPHIYIPKFLAFIGGKIRRYALADKNFDYRGIQVESPACLWHKELLNNHQNLKYALYRLSVKRYLVKACKEFKPDLIYGLDPVLDGRLCVEVGKELNIPVVLIEHNVPSNYRNFVNNKEAISTYRNTVNGASKTIFVTHSQKKLFDELIGENINGEVIHNGFVNENKNLKLKSYTYSTEKTLKLITVGFLEDRKGYPTLFKAIANYKKNGGKVKSVIIGDGTDRSRYEKMVEDMGIKEICEFKGIVSHEEVFEEMRASDLFVLPSYEESFGIVYLEAMSCGLPIIGTQNEGISDIVSHGVNGFLIPRDDPDALCNMIEYVANNPDIVNKIAKCGYESVDNLTWKANAEAVVKLFESVISESK